MSEAISADVAVLGAGPGGYAAAFRAADLGRSVVLIDPEAHPGGVCLHKGCIPSKAYLHIAKLINEAAEAARCGVAFGEPQLDIPRLSAWRAEVVEELTSGLSALAKARGVTYVRGRGVFRDAQSIVVEGEAPGSVEVRFEHAIVATGSRPVALTGMLEGSDRVLNSTSALELERVPGRLLVVGGGYIGLELGSVYAALGSTVTVVEMADGLLPGADRDLVRVLEGEIAPRFDAIHCSTRLLGLAERNGEVRAEFAAAAEAADGETRTGEFDAVLVSVGRRPNSSGLGLAETGVEIDDHGFIRVDAAGRTAERSIYAIGDVAGEPMLAHKATHQGIVAAEAICGQPAAFEPNVIPAVVFTDPELAWCGLTEAEASAQGVEHEVARFPWQASGRAKTLGRDRGLTKLLVDPKTERILGAGVVGAGAGELISELALAIEMGAVASDLAATVHPHPTLSETVMESAEIYYGQSVHLYKRRPKSRD